MQKDDQSTAWVAKAAKLLKCAYKRSKSWPRVARRYGLNGPGTAWNIAHGKQPPPPHLVAELARQKNMDGGKRKFMRSIKTVAVPFLQARLVSPSHTYTRGRKPVECPNGKRQ